MIEHKKLGFIYTVEHIGINGEIKSTEEVENVIPLVGINYILATALNKGPQFSSWYIGLFKANRTPIFGDDMTSLIADCEEASSYGSISRTSVVFPSVTEGSITTLASPSVFTFSADTTIQGGFITSSVTIGSTTGLLISAVKFTSPKVISAGESLKVPVGIAMTSI